MEYHRKTKNRAAQAKAVVNPYFSTMRIGAITATQRVEQLQELGWRAQQHDDAPTAFDAANSAENGAVRG